MLTNQTFKLLLLGVMFSCSYSFAQGYGQSIEEMPPTDDNSKVVNMRLSPIPLILGMGKVNVQFAIADRVSLGVGGSTLFNDGPIKAAVEDEDSSIRTYDYDISAHSMEVRSDIGLSGNVMGNTWLASVIVDQLEVTVKDTLTQESASGSLTSIKGLAGYQWMFGVFNINVGGGLAVPIKEEYDTSNLNNVEDEDFEKLGTSLALDFNLGLAF